MKFELSTITDALKPILEVAGVVGTASAVTSAATAVGGGLGTDLQTFGTRRTCADVGSQKLTRW